MEAFFAVLGFDAQKLIAASHFILTVTVAVLVSKLVSGGHHNFGNNDGGGGGGGQPPPTPQQPVARLGQHGGWCGWLPPVPAALAVLQAPHLVAGIWPRLVHEEFWDADMQDFIREFNVGEVNEFLATYVSHLPDGPLDAVQCRTIMTPHFFVCRGSNHRAARGTCIRCGLMYTYNREQQCLRIYRTR